jgi:ABC-type nitrate/sulfonate/bicarbonate transport system substrate-binding protein
MRCGKFLTAAALWTLAGWLCLFPAAAAENVVIAYPTTSSQFTPLWFARDVGLYEKYGLDSKSVFVQGGSVLLQAMLAGQVHAAQNGIAETIVAIHRGGDVKILGVTANIFP